MKVWVSGSAGKLGREVVAQLLGDGHEVVEADVKCEHPVDLEDPAAVRASLSGCDAIIHCAGIPSPEDVEPADLVRINTMATFNALEQAWLDGVRVAVLASSGSIYGTAWGPEHLRQPYVPLDEQSPLQYVDPYALSKDFMERTGQMYARRGMTVTALRFHWILTPDEIATFDQAADEQTKNLWGYVALADAARACVLGITPREDREPYEVCLITAADTIADAPTEELLARHSPESRITRPLPAHAGCFDLSHADRVLGWQPSTRGCGTATRVQPVNQGWIRVRRGPSATDLR